MNKIEAKNISVSAGGKEIVKDFSFELASGEIRVLLGANGSGKSSVVSALFGHPKYAINSGAFFLNSEDITALSTDKKAKKGLFLSPQHIPEIDGVSFANFLHRAWKELRGEDMPIMEFQKFLGEKAREYGFAEDSLRRFVNVGFSGGEKKLAEAFQLFLFEPKFAFLDEIDSGADIDAVGKMFGVIKTLREKGTGFFLITHYIHTLNLISPDKIYLMKEGQIIREGGPELADEIREKGFSGLEK